MSQTNSQSDYEKHKPINDMLATGARSRWSRLKDLDRKNKRMLLFEPGEVVRVHGTNFKILRVQLEPPLLVIEPI